ncbi:antibiotic biosynthesis monooxygenase [Streptomyces sp. KPB2]|uniref:Anthrone oxygenase n=1 Tax=Streptomyces griseoruber TaxID=1943 RepID=Q67G52_9ACTN|nr:MULTISPECIES: antibiotic biosynthesis monooxygenase family protein [Streptomyces]AAP85340.1 anthrone oxygenase [Streptomyces griseoruber]QPM92766.1 anthrone oxygenase [Streptomyces sp.]AZM79837.1 antibiotic biosynthesis monooxygenase [Streptomyces sp. KPB2]MBH5129561.1 antibiotic biosynthesis monooxygenase [Streptomyces sp. HB-N217]QKW65465.1 antibiotic biosynthesis monooxygenase [Streptomyces sp. NA03103]
MDRNGPPPGAVTFINRFTVTGDPEEFEAAFAKVAAFMTARPGILGHTLSRHLDEPGQYVNVAVWRDAGSLRAAVAHPDFGAHAGELRRLATSESDVYVERQRHLGGAGGRQGEAV